MTKILLMRRLVLAATVFAVVSASAQDRTTPITAADIEAAYTQRLEKRTADIVADLALNDAAKSNRVTDIIIRHYRALKSRDEVITAAIGNDVDKNDSARLKMYQTINKPLQAQFLAKLSMELTPDQIEKVKDKMTYGRFQANYDSYCSVVPNLSDSEKTKIKEILTEAREEAMGGGSATEKAEIFQKYKEKINEYLTAHGHDVTKAYAEWRAKQEPAKSSKDDAAPKSATAQ